MISLNEQNQNEQITSIGLKQLSEEDIQELSEVIYDLTRINLRKRVLESKVDFYDIVIDIDNSTKNLQISIDIIYNASNKQKEKEEALIKDTLDETFAELDKILEEKFTS